MDNKNKKEKKFVFAALEENKADEKDKDLSFKEIHEKDSSLN